MKLPFAAKGADTPPTTKLSDSSAGSAPTAFRVEPAKSSTVPSQPVKPTVPVPVLAEILVGTPPEPGADAVVMDSELKLKAATSAAWAGNAQRANTHDVARREDLIFMND